MAFKAALLDPLGRHLANYRCWKAMKSEVVTVKSEGTLHTSPLITIPVLLFVPWATRLTKYIVYIFWSGDPRMLCWVHIIDGVRAGPTWAPSSEESLK